MDEAELVANFCGITGADEAQAFSMLEASNFDLQEAVNLYWAVQDGHGPTSAAGTGIGSLGPSDLTPDEVRAPLASKVDRLYGDTVRPTQMTVDRGQGGPSRRPGPPIDIFKEDNKNKDELSGSAASLSAGSRPLAPVLSDLFKAPTELMYKGNMDTAAHVAVTENKWLMLNVQSSTEFDSHRLNRDTWSHEAVQLAVGGMFLFIQLHDATPEGLRACSSYQLLRLPAILVLDPTTGAKLYERVGFIDPEHLLEDLVPFMDHGPKDPGASEVAKQSMRRMAAGQTLGRTGGVSGSAPRAAGQSGAPSSSTGAAKGLSEDEELALAIAMSMEGRAEGPGADGLTEDVEDAGPAQAADGRGSAGAAAVVRDTSAQPSAPNPKPKALSQEELARVQSDASARVGTEPAPGEPGTCRVMLRLPNGDRCPRRFRCEDPVQLLRDWAVSVLEDAARGRPFALAVTGPGGHQLADPSQTLKTAGAEGAVVTVTWSADA